MYIERKLNVKRIKFNFNTILHSADPAAVATAIIIRCIIFYQQIIRNNRCFKLYFFSTLACSNYYLLVSRIIFSKPYTLI